MVTGTNLSLYPTWSFGGALGPQHGPHVLTLPSRVVGVKRTLLHSEFLL